MLGFANESRLGGLLARIAVLTFLFAGLQLSDISNLSPANAADPVTLNCRSTDGTGVTRESDALKNGFYSSLASRASDSIDGLIIKPVFAKRMYVDTSRNFDATYIAYQIENTTASTYAGAEIALNFLGTVIRPVSHEDNSATVTIPAKSGANNGVVTAYFMARATGPTEEFQNHEVRVLQSNGTQLAGCVTGIEGVQRSLSASANKVTAINVNPTTLALDQTFDVSVTGAPGRIGSGSGPDMSVMAFSPASNSSWPTMAIRLESVNFLLRGFNGNSSAGACQATGATTNNANKTATWTNTLVIRNFASCADTNKHTYVATYTFRLIGSAATNPIIRPLASIASGTQVKYTGTLPSVDVSVPITTAVKPTVSKAGGSCTTTGASAGKIRVPFTVTVSLTGGTTSLDKIRDVPSVPGTFISATYIDVNKSSATALPAPTVTTESSRTYWDFAPTDQLVKKFVVSSTRTIVLTYVVEYPLPASGTTTSYSNQAYALYGDVVVGSGDNVLGVSFSLTSTTSSGCTFTPTSEPKPKEPQAITFEAPSSIGAGTSLTLSAYSDSGLFVNLTSLTPSDCTISFFNNVYTVYGITQGATCTIQASQGGNTTFDAATPVSRNITISKGQVISYTAGIFNTNPTTTVKVGATSRLAVSLISIDTSVCTVSGVAIAYNATTGETTYTISKIGTSGSCILTASQSGNSEWGAAPSRDILIGVGLAQVIDFTTPANGTAYKTPDVTSFSAAATAKDSSGVASGNPVYFGSSTPAVCSVVQAVDGSNNAVSGYNATTKATTVTINILSPGTCLLTADQDGLRDDGTDSGYASAAQVAKTASITGTGSTTQNLTFLESGFNNPTTKTYGDANFSITVWSKKTDNSATGLLVAVATTTPAVCELGTSSLSGNNTIFSVKLLAQGDCVIKADQGGNNTYAKATQASFTITVSPKALTVVGLSPTKIYDGDTTVSSWGGTGSLSGVVVGDGVGEISLAGSPSGVYPDKLVGNPKNISVTGYSITGSKSSSYTLSALTVAGEITARPITITYTAVTKTNADSLPTCIPAEVSITSALTLAGTDKLTGLSCSGIPASMATAGTYPITPSAAVIKDSAEANVLTGNYGITYVSGNLVITTKEIPDLEAPEITIVYGDLLSTLSADSSSTVNSKVKAKSKSNNLLSGSITHRRNGQTVNTELEVGTYLIDIEYVPAEDIKANFSDKQGTRTINIIKRKLRVANIVIKDKLYDGTDYAELESGSTPALQADPIVTDDVNRTAAKGYGYGVRAGDTVSLSTSPTIKFASVNVGTSVSVDYSNTLTGSSAGNYELATPGSISGKIMARKLTYSVTASDKVYDGLRSASVSASNSLIADPAGDNAGVLSGDDVTLNGTATGTFAFADVGSSVGVVVSGKALAGDKRTNYTLTQPAGVSAAIIARKLTLTNLTPINKQYDGTRNATVTGTPGLTALLVSAGGNSDEGIVSTDNGQVSLDNASAAFEFSSKNVGDSRAVTVSGKSLTGSRAGNYTLHTPPGLAANITKRPLKFVVASHKSKFVDQVDPTFTYSLDGTTSFASGEDGSTIGGLSVSRESGTEPGAYSVSVTSGSMADSTPKNNYDITVEEKKLYIARATITTTKAGGLVTLPGVNCGCEGFRPGATVYLKMYSTPTTLDTDVVTAQGTCPNLSGTIPDGTTGNHTLEITSDFPNDDPLLYSEPITLASVTPSPSPSPSSSPSPSASPSSSPSPSPSPTNTASPTSNQKLSVFVWLDLNGNGKQDEGEPDLPGLLLEISQTQIVSAIKAAIVNTTTWIAGVAAGDVVSAALATAQTEVDGFLRLDSVSVGNWIIRALLPSKLDPTQDSDSTSDGQILATISPGLIMDTWMGVKGNAAINSPIYDSNNQLTNEEIEILWEGLDEKLISWDDVTFTRDPESGILKFTALPAGNYRLIRVGSTQSDSECVDIKLEENKTFTQSVITQKSAVCYTAATKISGVVKDGTKPGSGTAGLAETGSEPWGRQWGLISTGLILSGFWLVYRGRRRQTEIPN